MNAKEEQREKSHGAILASAAQLLRQHGISGTSVSDVMKGAGLTVGGFYTHFDSKQNLVDEVLRGIWASQLDELFARPNNKHEHSPAAEVVKRYLSTRHRETPLQGCPLPAAVGDIATTAPEHVPLLEELVEDFSSRLEACLPKRQGISNRSLAFGLVALMYGGMSLARGLRGSALSDEVLSACRALGVAALGDKR
jgi:TetR/AcrR family transcriptional repressor of nem operon